MSACTVYVTGLPSSATQDDVIDFFTRIGNVAEVQMPAVNTGAPVAVVFDKPEDAASAVSITGSDFQEDIPIHISAHATSAATAEAPAAPTTPAGTAAEAAPGSEAAASAADGAAGQGRKRYVRDNPSDITNKVVVSKLAPSTKRGDIHSVFDACGEIDDFALMPARHIAFIGYTTAEAFEKALQLDGTEINGARVTVERRHGGNLASERVKNGGERSSTSGPTTIPNRIVVRNVPRNVNKDGLRAFFEPECGAATDIYVKPEVGIAFMAFASEESADKAIAKSGQEYEGNVIQIERRQVLVCRRCGREGHKGSECRQPYCTECRTAGHNLRECPRGRGGGGRVVDRRRRRSSSSDRGHRRRRSDSLDQDRRRRRHSRSRSPPRHRRHSRSRSPPRRRRHSRSRSPPRGQR
ncbi:putative RNA-binding protein [Leptomonas seymouri]|uniref:Putative RNA-binding protein n=1 Tax=Leptomonas seymouri TaxID=5684 RepID=A0A0N1IMB5_LEPSE|nr:putative RNA-binding protein [Leptomonas seymouri]|eukprot:KPI89924.1 putative RNA-binding protein [Leptomonas seymouri]